MFSLRSFPNVQIMLLITIGVLLSAGCASVPKPIPLISFKSTPTKIDVGETAILSWTVSNADSITISPFDGSLAASGVKSITPVITTTYQLTAYYGDKSISHNVEVVVNKPQPKMEDMPPPQPIAETPNTTKSDYLKGTINYENVANKNSLRVIINSIDHSNYPKTVKLYCTVLDAFGNHVANLAPPFNYGKSAFWNSVVETHKNKTDNIETFTVEEVRKENAPAISSVLVADYSGSMRSDIGNLEQALKTSVTYIRPDKDLYSVVQFDHRAGQTIAPTNQISALSSLIPFDNLSGGTAFYQAAVLGISSLSGQNTQKVAILFTDGIDNASLIETANDVINLSRKENVRVFVIGYSLANRDILRAIALQTGGHAYFPTSSSDLPDIFAQIYQFLKVHYIITYTSDGDKSIKNVQLTVEPAPNTKVTDQATYYPVAEIIDEPRIYDVAWFKPNSTQIDEGSNQSVNLLIDMLKKMPDKKIEVYAHTDSRGSEQSNLQLSKKRVNAFVELLVKKGITRKQIIKYDGKGKKELIHKNDKDIPWMQQENRRCEVRFV